MTTGGDRDDRVHPTREDPVATALSEGIGGPMGARGAGHRWWTPVRVVLLLTALCFALGMVQKDSCYAQTWQNGTSRYSHMCYSDMPYLYTGRGFAELNWPYTEDPQVRARYEVMEYPVGISYFAYAAAWVTHWGTGSPDITPRFGHSVDYLFSEAPVRKEVRLFVVVSALGLAAATLLAAWFLASVDRLRPWDALLFALSPALALNALVNWDLLAVVTVAGALWAWARGKPGLTGVLIGIGTATKLYPLFLLGGLLVIGLRDRRIEEFLRATFAGILAWVVVNAPAFVTGPSEWKVFWHFNSDRGADLGSIWLVLQQVKDSPDSPFAFQAHTINTWSWLIFGTWCVGVFLVGMRAPLTPRLAQLGYLVVAGFLLVNKVYSPQYVLWLLPLAVLARPRWRDQIVWQATEVFYFACVWWYLGGFLAPAAGGDAGFYWVAILLRMAGELYLVGLVVRDVLRPEHDPARHARLPAEPDDTDEPVGSSGQSMTTRSNAVAV